MTLKADAALLLERLRNAHRARVDAIAARKDGAAHAAATIAQDLVDDASPELLRAALTLAVRPDGGQPPIPVVFGPHDAAAVVGREEVMALVGVYGSALVAWCGTPGDETRDRVVQAHAAVNEAVATLALAAVIGQLGTAHSEGRLS